MPLVPETTLKGNYGTAVVMARLGRQCLVRPVAADTDVGVDLYCETVIESQPFLHFWMQVKAGSQCKIDPVEDRASYTFRCDHLRYWARQPVPVYAALVPTGWPATTEPDVYIVDLTTHLLFEEVPSDQQQLTIWSDFHWPAGSNEHVASFLRVVVPEGMAKVMVPKGTLQSVPTLSPEYVNHTPYAPVGRYRNEILHQLRRTAANGILFSIAEDTSVGELASFRRKLAQLLEVFEDDPHWENYMARGLSYHIDGLFDNAISMYARAREVIDGDARIREEPYWRGRMQRIEDLAAKAHEKQPPG